jgi:hypothetical protein
MKPSRVTPILIAGLLSTIVTLGVPHLPWRAAGSAGAQGATSVVRAQRFELVDANGTLRGVMSMTSDGRPIVALLDEAGQVRVTMDQNQAEGEYGFGIVDGQGTTRFAVATTKRGFVGLNVRDGAGTIRANMQASDDGSSAAFRVWDSDNNPRAQMAMQQGDVSVGVCNPVQPNSCQVP